MRNDALVAVDQHRSVEIEVLFMDGGPAPADVSAATLFTLRHQKEIGALGFSADGARSVTGSEDDVRLWDATSGKETVRFNPQGKVARVLLNDDNTVLAISADKSSGRHWM